MSHKRLLTAALMYLTNSKDPDITVKLIGENSNAFNILGICIKAMRRAGLTEEQVDEFRMEATSGDYQHLLNTCMRYFEIE